jgi:hypothetical protein
MVPGFNHNVKYRGRIFHCQTEDSGIGNPHIITHLFVGGNILATKKTSYADIVKTDRLEEVVSELMQEQHKEILKKLLSGQYDDAIEQRGQGATHLNGPAPLNVDAGAQNRASMLAPGNMAEAPKKEPIAKPAPVTAPVAPVVSNTVPQVAAQAAAKTQAVAQAAKAQAGAAVPQEVIDAQKLQVAPKPKEAPATGTIFGEDLISEKSLDEVILSYLSQEADR